MRLGPSGALVALLLAAIGALVLIPGAATATSGLPPGVSSQGIPMGDGLPGFVALYGQSGTPFGPVFLEDHQLVYDTSVDVILLYSGTGPIALNVSAEQYVPGTTTRYVNETEGNSTALVPIQVPAQLSPQWSNTTVTLLPRSGTYVSLDLPTASSRESLTVSVAGTTWSMVHLTPASSSLAGLYSTGGLEVLALTESAVTTIVIVGFLALARLLAGRVHQTPSVPFLWPMLWVLVPVGAYMGDFVSTNQLLGSLSPWLYPFFFATAAFPYLPRLFRRSRMAEFQSFKPRSSREGTNPKALLPIVDTRDGLRCAPESWREVLYTLLGVPLPEVRMDAVRSGGLELRLEPSGLPVTCPLDSSYAAEADVSYWYDARKGLKRTHHRLRFTATRSSSREVRQPDGSTRTETTSRRRFDPHVERGSFVGSYPPMQEIAEYLAGIRTAEQEAVDHEVDRLMVAELRGQLVRVGRERSTQLLDVALEAVYTSASPATREELERRVVASRRMKARTTEERGGEGEAPN